MARLTQFERRVNRCYYWTPLSYEECVERELDRARTGQPTGPTPTILPSRFEHNKPADKPNTKHGIWVIAALLLIAAYLLYK